MCRSIYHDAVIAFYPFQQDLFTSCPQLRFWASSGSCDCRWAMGQNPYLLMVSSLVPWHHVTTRGQTSVAFPMWNLLRSGKTLQSDAEITAKFSPGCSVHPMAMATHQIIHTGVMLHIINILVPAVSSASAHKFKDSNLELESDSRVGVSPHVKCEELNLFKYSSQEASGSGNRRRSHSTTITDYYDTGDLTGDFKGDLDRVPHLLDLHFKGKADQRPCSVPECFLTPTWISYTHHLILMLFLTRWVLPEGGAPPRRVCCSQNLEMQNQASPLGFTEEMAA